MANLRQTTAGKTTVTGAVLPSQINSSEWIKLSHCVCPAPDGTSDCIGNGRPYLHVRTPIPADNAAGNIGWIPWLLEVTGYHTYSGERFHDFKAVVNNNGYDDSFYGSQVRVNRGNGNSQPYVYRSSSTYGGYRRLCFAVGKISCCCTGYLWVRAWYQLTHRISYPWATTTADTNSQVKY